MEAKEPNFSRREWLFLIAILLMGEYAVFKTSHELVGTNDMVNYVSFASAIVSILLAVIAIFYSFIQGENQQKISGVISSQIDGLKSASKQFTESKDQLRAELDRVSAVTAKIDNLETLVGGGFSKMDQAFAAFKQDVKLQPTAAIHNAAVNAPEADTPPMVVPIALNNAQKEELSKRLIRFSTYDTYLMEYALYLWLKSGDKDMKWTDFISKHFAQPLATHVPERSSYPANLDLGFQILAMMQAAELLELVPAGPLKLGPELTKVILNKTPEDRKKDPPGHVGRLYPVIEASFPTAP